MEIKKKNKRQSFRKVTLKEAREFAAQLWDDKITARKIRGIGIVVDKKYPFLKGNPFKIKDENLIDAFMKAVTKGALQCFFLN